MAGHDQGAEVSKPNLLDEAAEIVRLVVAYSKQETVEPLKSLLNYLLYGIAGSILMFAGVMFVGLATLRLLQSFDLFAGGSWASTLPYLAAILLLTVAIGLIYLSLSRARRKVLS